MLFNSSEDRMPFGKYKDWLLSQVPCDYFHWLLKQADLDPSDRAMFEGYVNTTGFEMRLIREQEIQEATRGKGRGRGRRR
jgi:hypothetical protein